MSCGQDYRSIFNTISIEPTIRTSMKKALARTLCLSGDKQDKSSAYLTAWEDSDLA